MRLTMTVICTAAALLTGCKSDEPRERQADRPIAAPLELDPTEHVALAHWWSNGKQLLHLDDSAFYSLHEGLNRYNAPIERGRWAQQSYAALWLEPYTTAQAQRMRVTITKIDGKLALVLPKAEPMFALERPPATLEDRLIGKWNGAIGTLRLNDDMRYTLASAAGATASKSTPAVRGSHVGYWSIINQQLVLQPDGPGDEPLRLPLTVEKDRVMIDAPGGAMTLAGKTG